jgi:hypothetical protein
MILFDKAENEYPTHFWISVKSLKKGCFLGARLSNIKYKRGYRSVVSTVHSLKHIKRVCIQ